MKKIYTIAALLGLSTAGLMAQNLIKKTPLATKSKTESFQRTNNNQSSANSAAAILWSDDFSTPSNWTMTHESGSTGDWVINNIGPIGTYAIDTINSTTSANGFALFDSDFICSSNQQAHITTANPIDLSSSPAVVLQFQQQYRRFYDSTFVQVSNDGTTWTKFDVNKNLGASDYPTSGNNPDTVTINISNVAGGQPTVWIRFTFYSVAPDMGTAAGCAYSWMVDDVSLMTAPNHEVKIQDIFHTQYSKIPLGQQMPIIPSAYIVNDGATVQTNVALNVKVTPGTYDETSTPVTLNIAEEQLFEIVNPYTPGSTLGNYTITLSAIQDSTDANPANNTKTGTFEVTDSVFARDNNFYTGGIYYGPGVTYELGNIFEITNAAYAKSVSFVLGGGASSDGLDVKAKLYEVTDTSVDPWVFDLIAESDPHTIAPSDKPTTSGTNPPAVTLNLTGGPIALNPATMYLVSVENSGASSTTYVSMADGSDYALPLGTTWVNVDNQWGASDAAPMIRLIMAVGVGIEETANNNNVSVYPNPSNGFVTINSDITEKSTISVINTVGQVVYAEASASVANKNLDLSGLAKGVYFVQIVSEKASVTKKIILE